MKDLKVTKTKTNQNGEITLTCTAEGAEIYLFLGALKDANGDAVLATIFEGKTIDAKGIVDKYYEKYQIRVTSVDDITIH
jgi:DNA/RNA endonuclease YhcR with UshA esterase domain